MNNRSYSSRDVTLSAGKANFKAMAFAIPTLLLFGLPFFLLWGQHISSKALLNIMYSVYSVPILVAGIIAHELIHGFFWSLYAENGLKSMKYGIQWKLLTPYCHCSEPLKVGAYRVGIIMPAMILGIAPSVVAVTIGNMALLVFGVFFTMAAGGDFLMMIMLRKADKNDLVQDHPSKIGCVLYGSYDE